MPTARRIRPCDTAERVPSWPRSTPPPALGPEVIAEGMETREQAVALAEIGNLRDVHGNHFGLPTGESEAAELLDES